MDPFEESYNKFAAYTILGVVVRPYIDRKADDGTRLALKIINPKYKETGEEFN